MEASDDVRDNLKESTDKMEVHYGKERNFVPGNKVLVFLPIPSQPLCARYHGPSVILTVLYKHSFVMSI